MEKGITRNFQNVQPRYPSVIASLGCQSLEAESGGEDFRISRAFSVLEIEIFGGKIWIVLVADVDIPDLDLEVLDDVPDERGAWKESKK